jgi:hypothetical protein
VESRKKMIEEYYMHYENKIMRPINNYKRAWEKGDKKE